MSRARFVSGLNAFQKGNDEVEFDSRPGSPITSKSDENVEKAERL
jgi:hypothetical protein